MFCCGSSHVKKHGEWKKSPGLVQESMENLTPKQDYQSSKKEKTIVLDNSQLKIGQYSLEKDLGASRKLAEQYNKDKRKFYYYVRSQLKMSDSTPIKAMHIEELFEKDPEALKRGILEFQPSCSTKWNCWTLLAGDKRFKTIGEEELRILVEHKKDSVEDIVKKDVPRTFNSKDFFAKPVEEVMVGREMLFKICKAVGVYYKSIGYTQGFNFLAAFALEISGARELQTTNFLISLLRNERFMLAGMFDDRFPLVYFLEFLFHEKLREINETLEKAFTNTGMPDEVWLHKWLMCLFSGYFPSYFSSRIFDLVLASDIFSLVSFVLAMICSVKKKLLQHDGDMGSMVEFLNSLSESPEIHKEINTFVKLAQRKYKLANYFVLQKLESFKTHPLYPEGKFERYEKIFRKYLEKSNNQVPRSETNITVFDFENDDIIQLSPQRPPTSSSKVVKIDSKCESNLNLANPEHFESIVEEENKNVQFSHVTLPAPAQKPDGIQDIPETKKINTLFSKKNQPAGNVANLGNVSNAAKNNKFTSELPPKPTDPNTLFNGQASDGSLDFGTPRKKENEKENNNQKKQNETNEQKKQKEAKNRENAEISKDVKSTLPPYPVQTVSDLKDRTGGGPERGDKNRFSLHSQEVHVQARTSGTGLNKQ